MQTVLHIHCSQGPSLRERIANDSKLASYGLSVIKQHQHGREPGWLKIHSTDNTIRGAINIEWDPDGPVLLARVVNRASGRPNAIVGDFIDYVLARFRRRLKAIVVVPN